MTKSSQKFKLYYGNIISKSSKCFIVAEIGINHNGSLYLAKKMIIAAKKSGANAVKFQNYEVDDFIKNKKLLFKYKYKNKIISTNQYDMFKKLQLSNSNIIYLKKFCDQLKIIFFSTPTSPKGVDFLKKIRVPIIKNGSDFLSDLNLIKHMAKSNLLTILSTGMATLKNIDAAVDVYQKNGGKKLILLHCTSQYPTKLDEVNLMKIDKLKKRYDCLIGFSDHTEGNISASLSVVLGSKIIEKHFTTNKKLKGPDHAISANPQEFRDLVLNIRKNEMIMGSSSFSISKKEKMSKQKFSLSAFYKFNYSYGHKITLNDLIFRRPGNGLNQSQTSKILGKKLKQNVKKNQITKQKHFYAN